MPIESQNKTILIIDRKLSNPAIDILLLPSRREFKSGMTQSAKSITISIVLLLLTCIPMLSFSQCECTDCPVFLPSNSTASSSIDISGATNNTLGQSGQQLCRICIDLSTDAIRELTFELTAPDGSTVLLFDDSGININSNMEFDICFVSCGDSAMPDAGHNSVFDTNDNWESNTSFNGSYYPFIGCLEDFTGTVDGTWTLDMEDDTAQDDSNINDWYMVFADDDGLGCANASACNLVICDANAGTIDVTNSPACPAETIGLTVSDNNTDSEYENLILIVDETGVIVELFIGNSADYTYGYCGDFTAYSYNYEIGNVANLPHVGDMIDDFDCNVDCCDLSEVAFSYEDLTNPFFTYLPPHPAFDPITGMLEPVYCIDDLPEAEDAEYDDNCIGEGVSEVIITDLSDFCDGGLLFWAWALMDSCENSGTVLNQVTITIEPAPDASFVNPPADYTTDCGSIPTSAPLLTYTNGQSNSCLIEGSALPIIEDNTTACGGEVLVTWSDIDICGRNVEYVQTITVEPPADPYFVDLPDDIDISCDEIPVDIPSLMVTNGESGICLIEEEVFATVEDNYNGCSGTITYTWDYMTACDISLNHVQTLTILPPPIAAFIDPPGSDILPCNELDILSTTLQYTNEDSGDCQIEGEVEAIVIGDINPCGGAISYFWEYIDDCGRPISHTQNITLLAAVEPMFLDVPDDITLACDDTYDPDPLFYSNGVSGDCQINGSVDPTTSQIDNIITVSWIYTQCDNSDLIATQTVTLLDNPEIEVTPSTVSICDGESYDLQNLSIDFMGNENGIITYHSDDPPNVANELVGSVVTPLDDAVYYILVTFPDGCEAYDEVSIMLDIPVSSAESATEIVCDQGIPYDFFDVLVNVSNNQGTWFDLDESGIDISDPTNVDFSTLEIGIYRYEYTGVSENSCLPDVSIATIIIGEQVILNAESIDCAADELTYSVQIETNQNAEVNASLGIVNTINDSVYQIVDIPIDSTVTIYGLGVNSICNDSLAIASPDCSCPDIPPPSGTANSLCPHEAPTTITATVDNGLIINWYDVAIGGSPIATNVNEYMPNVTDPGFYTYYLESVDANGCTSDIRSEVWFTIYAPVAEDTIFLSSCIDFENEESIFTLLEIYQLLEINVSAPLPWIIDIYNSLTDAENESNAIAQDFALLGDSQRTIFARVLDDNGCFGIVPITLIPLEYPNALLNITNEICSGGSDGIVELTLLQDSVLTAIDDFDYSSEVLYNDLSSGVHSIHLLDSNMCVNELMFEIEIGYIISLNTIDFICSSNDTGDDESDDFWTMIFDVSTDSGSSSFTLLIDGIDNGTYNYDQEYAIIIPADELVHTILFVDDLTGCNNPISSPLLNPCSVPCIVFPDATINLDASSVLDCQSTEILASSLNETNVVYDWFFDGQVFSPSDLISSPGQLTLYATDTLSGCVSDSTIAILSIASDPSIVILQPDELTCEDGMVIIDASMSDEDAAIFYQWSDQNGNIDGATTEYLNVTSAGWYYLELFNVNNNCSQLDSVLVSEDGERPIIDLSDIYIGECGNDEGVITTTISNASNYTINWTTVDGTIVGPIDMASIDFEGQGIYYITVVNEDNLCAASDSIIVVLEPVPTLNNLVIMDIYCDPIADAVIQLDQLGGTEPYDYFINGEMVSVDSEIELPAGEYSLQLIDANGCEVDTMITVNMAPEIVVNLDPEIEYIDGLENILDAIVNIPEEDIATILWSPSENLSCYDCLSPIILSGVNQVYSVTVVDSNGCQASATTEVIFEEILTPPFDIIVPNIFSPNGDGVNDYFVITIPEGLALDYLEVYVFDRWGEQVYFGDQLQSADDSAFWNGMFNGQNVNPGVYIYYAKAVVANSFEELILFGDVSIIR